MAGRDHHKGHQQLLGICKILPPLVLSCVALWFSGFLFHHSTPKTLYQRINSEEEGNPNPNQITATHIGSYSHQQSTKPQDKDDTNLGILHPDQQSVFSASDSNLLPFSPGCDFASGRWIRDQHRKPAYDESCRDIFKGWNCLRNNKSNAKDLLAWRWQPWHCDLPQINATLLLERFRNQRIGFVGDSLNRNMYVSLVCSLKHVAPQVKKWRPVGADKGVTFLDYNLTIAYHRTNLLARYGQWEAKEDGGGLESLGFKQGFRVDVDIPQSTWAEAPSFHDVLVLNTGHWWWAPEKFDPVKSPMLFFKAGEPIIPIKSPEQGLDLVLKYMLAYVERKMPAKGFRFLRTQSPRHFEGGEWNDGGKCRRHKPLDGKEVKAFLKVEGKPGPNVEMSLANLYLEKAIKGTSFRLLNISYMSSLRADAHPSSSGGKLHEDCMHWCLPGITDTWNDMLASELLLHSEKILEN